MRVLEPDVNLAKILILEWIERAPSGPVSDLHQLYHLLCSNDESGEKIVSDYFREKVFFEVTLNVNQKSINQG